MKNLLKLTLLLLALLLPATATAYDFEVNGIYYDIINDNEAAVTFIYEDPGGYHSDYSGDIIIPSSVTYNGTTFSVTAISIGAFEFCDELTSINIPNSITSIGSEAFCCCSGLTSVTIPNSVTSIGVGAFFYCSGLVSISVSSDNQNYDSRDNCNSIIESATNTLISGCKNTIIPNSVTSIGYGAFVGCSDLTSITIPNSVTSIGSDAFDGTAWYNNQPDGLVYAGLVAYRYKGTMPTGTNITLKDNTLGIAASAFYRCSGLKSITIPNSVTSIGSSAFVSCSGLTSVTIPNSVISIGSEAFYGCSGLTSITIPNSVTSIGSSVFSGCSGLTSISVSSDNQNYDSRDNCNAIIESASTTLISGCKNTTIPNSVTSIGRSVFSGCSGLTSITIPNSVTSIGDHAFYGCSELTSITIPNSVTSIGDRTFSSCSRLTSITIPNSVTSIGTCAFERTAWYNNQPNGLVYAGLVAYDYKGTMPTGTSITLKDNTLGIANYAFSGCSGLTSITIPNSVISIGTCAFNGTAWYNNQPDGLVYAGLVAYRYKGTMPTGTNITLKDNTLGIAGSAFSDCSGLKSITIPNSVKSIGGYAFYDCSRLNEVYSHIIDLSAISMGNSVFESYSPNYVIRTLYVPRGSSAAYQTDTKWSDYFGSIVEMVPIPQYDFEIDGIYYKQTEENSVIVSSGEEAYQGNIVIPETVTDDGVTYAVTGIGCGAFANDSLNFLTIPVSVTCNIASDAFEGSFVKSVYIIGEGAWADGALPASVDTLYISGGVTGVEGLQVNPSAIYSYAAVPPTCDENSFTGYGAQLNVPSSSLAAYFTAPYWSNFIDIMGDAVEPTGLSLENDSISIMLGNSITLTATVTPDNAMPPQVFWASTNDSIAKIGPTNGELIALKAGECDIKAIHLDKTVVCHVTVTEIAPTEVILSQEFAKLEVGSQLPLTATVLPEDATDKVITWTTTNSAVATVDSLGNVLAIGPGECFITATCRDNQAMCHVIVVEHFIFISLEQHSLMLLPNHIELLTPTITPVSTDLAVTSSNPSVAAARLANGKIQVVGIAEGATTIIVNSFDGYAEPDSCLVKVYTLRGDVNGDGYVNITDVTLLISYLLGTPSGDIHEINADCNNDGLINISDATRLISYLLTGAELEPKEEDENEVETETITVNGVSFDMVKVEGGTFMMGPTSKQGEEALARKSPCIK